MHSGIKRLLAVIVFIVAARTGYAGSATWNLTPADNDWHNATNWTPATVPNDDTDIATFGVSNLTTIRIGKYASGSNGVLTTLDTLRFQQGASSYAIEVIPKGIFGVYLYLVGEGVINQSGTVQNLLVAASGDRRQSAALSFYNGATAGENVVITNQGGASANGTSTYGAYTEFLNNSSAGKVTIINQGSTASGTIFGGFTNLSDNSGAENATFINDPGTVSGAAAGHTLIQTFLPGGNLGTSTFIANPATVPGAEGGWVEMDVGTCAGTSFVANGATVANCQAGQIYAYGAEYGTGQGLATYTAKGGNGSGTEGGLVDVLFVPANAQTIVSAETGTNGGLGGTILIEDSADIPLPQFQVFGNATLDLGNVSDDSMAIGSLAGDGIVLLGGHDLNVGNNNLNTTFSGVIQDEGSLTKTGTGALTLSGRNSYTGGTTVSDGVLLVNRSRGSGTGTGSVAVNAGTLGGSGKIAGAVTVGSGIGAGAFVQPSFGVNKPVTLTIQNTLTFKEDATYSYKVNSRQVRADSVVARGVTIASNAQFITTIVGRGILNVGTVFTAINNTAATPISGEFANLPDGSTFVLARNKFQVDYQGGDGNDLTLTVVP